MSLSRPPSPDWLAVKLWSARASLWAERLLGAFQWLLLWTGGFFALTLLGLFAPWLSAVFWLGFIIFLVIGIRHFRKPTLKEIQARLERDSRVTHRPLRSQKDEPASAMSVRASDLWLGERSRKTRLLSLLQWVQPRFSWTQRDPYALRVGLALLLVIGLVMSGPSAGGKLTAGLFPFAATFEAGENDALKIVITPPSYTRLPSLVLKGRPKDPVPVPQNSTVKVLMKSWIGHLSLKMGDSSTALIQEGDTDIFTADHKVPETESIRLVQWGIFPRITIPVAYKKDEPPKLSLREPVKIISGGQLRLPLTVEDDYGIKLIRVRAILSPTVKSRPLGKAVSEDQSIIANSDGKPLDVNPTFDLTGHPWAGFPVTLLIEAEDHAGQVAEIEPIEMNLPERVFRNQVSGQIIGVRKNLIRQGELAAIPTAIALEEILMRPGRYKWDVVATLALRSSASRITYQPDRESAETIVPVLWETALRLEDGNLTTSQKDLRKALDNLQKALQEKKSPDEIARLMQEFRDALTNHLMAMQKELQKKAEAGEMMPYDPNMMVQSLDPSMLQDFLSQLENEMMNGDADAAMKKLENLQKLTDMLNPSLAQPMPEEIKKQMQAMKDLQKIIDSQQALLDKTRSLQSGAQTSGEKQQQDGIKSTLEGMKSKASNAPPALNEAGESMGQSSGELEKNQPGGSVPHQQAALDKLREGRSQMQQALQQKLQNMMGLSLGGAQPMSNDPLGRGMPNNGRNMFDDGVKIPTASERKKADEILKVLRERSGDMSRPLSEREYYQRLLRQW